MGSKHTKIIEELVIYAKSIGYFVLMIILTSKLRINSMLFVHLNVLS